jgi:hypothetical protein
MDHLWLERARLTRRRHNVTAIIAIIINPVLTGYALTVLTSD